MKKDNYLFGIIGGLMMLIILLALIVITNVFASNISLFLTILIPFSILLGYKLFKGKITKKIMVIIIIISLISFLIANLVIIPLTDMYQVKMSLVFDNFKLIYMTQKTREVILSNTLISFIFNIISNIIVLFICFDEIKKTKTIKKNNNIDNIEFFDPDLY